MHKKFTRVKKLLTNPTLNIRETKIVGQDGIKFQATAEIIIQIEGIQFDDNDQIRIPPEWSPDQIKKVIEDLFAGHAINVFFGFEKKPIVKYELSKRGYRNDHGKMVR